MIKVLICDDQAVVCEGLRAILGAAGDLQVVGVAHDGEEALTLAESTQPDVILMDLKMPGMNGIQATRLLLERRPNQRVLVLTTYDFDEWVLDAVRSGASGYLLKDTPRETLLAAIRGTAQGQTYIDPAVAGKLLEQVRSGPTPATPAPAPEFLRRLNEREVEVLGLVARGLSNTEIAGRLHLSEGTVKNYVSGIE